jgi:hypothetical protein
MQPDCLEVDVSGDGATVVRASFDDIVAVELHDTTARPALSVFWSPAVPGTSSCCGGTAPSRCFRSATLVFGGGGDDGVGGTSTAPAASSSPSAATQAPSPADVAREWAQALFDAQQGKRSGAAVRTSSGARRRLHVFVNPVGGKRLALKMFTDDVEQMLTHARVDVTLIGAWPLGRLRRHPCARVGVVRCGVGLSWLQL